MATQRWKRRPEGSNWGDFGEHDQCGRLNLITPARRRAALKEAREGIVFNLSLPLDLPGPGVHAPYRQPPQLQYPIGQNIKLDEVFKVEGAIDVGNDDYVTLHLQYSTQWDSLAHVGAMFDADDDGAPEPRFYNGYQGAFGASGIDALGIENMAANGVQGRGVLVNLLKMYGPAKRRVDIKALKAALAAQHITVETGDILCLYTGYGDAVMQMGQKPDPAYLSDHFCALDGNDPALLQWITDCGLAALCADNLAVEAEPEGHRTGAAHCAPGSPFLPLHHHCLFKLGVHLGELWYFKELANWLGEKRRTRFLLTAPPLRLPGAVGSPVTPVATV